MDLNLKAFLDTLAFSEGTKGVGDNGYNVLFGGSLFNGYADHPRRSFFIARLGISTTAAGRYQILAKTFDFYKAKMGLPDFSPASQDAIAVQIISERRALDWIKAGEFDTAILRVNSIWASLPGAGYGQPEQKFTALRAAYVQFGGQLNDGHDSQTPTQLSLFTA